ncbi:MAG: FlgT C-terminal domain-containing protein [Desulfobacterales bacterium]|nr:FlgT C-terminal domain-containing protein [Desulfobacterales bacterium]
MIIHKAYIRVIFVAVIFLFSIFMIAGCSTYSSVKKSTKKIVRDITAVDDMKKKIAIYFFANHTPCTDQNLEELFQKNLAETINEACPDTLLVKPGDSECPDFLNRPLSMEAGRFDNLALAKAGRRLGMNAIVTGAFIDIKVYKEKQGFLWMKDDRNFLRVIISCEVYDIETGAEILDESFDYEVEIDETEFASIKAEKIKDTTALKDALSHIAEVMGEKICDTVDILPWKGYIVSTVNDKIIISSGRRAGLSRGDMLEVYESGKIIQGKDGRRFFLPGLKTGEIKITEVYPDDAHAVLITGDAIKAGSSVRIKQ